MYRPQDANGPARFEVVMVLDATEAKETIAELRTEADSLLRTLKAAEQIAKRLSPHPPPAQRSPFGSLFNFPIA